MHRVPRADLGYLIYNALRTAPKRIRAGFAGRLPQDGDAAAKAMAEILCNALDSDRSAVVRPDLVPGGDWGMATGTWGVTEPGPALPPPPPDPPIE